MPRLTERQVEVLRLIADGLRDKEIAHRLDVSIKTIEFHKGRIYEKVGASNAADAVRFGIREGYILRATEL